MKRYWAIVEKGFEVQHIEFDTDYEATNSLNRKIDRDFDNALGVYDSETNSLVKVHTSPDDRNHDYDIRKQLIFDYVLKKTGRDHEID